MDIIVTELKRKTDRPTINLEYNKRPSGAYLFDVEHSVEEKNGVYTHRFKFIWLRG